MVKNGLKEDGFMTLPMRMVVVYVLPREATSNPPPLLLLRRPPPPPPPPPPLPLPLPLPRHGKLTREIH